MATDTNCDIDNVLGVIDETIATLGDHLASGETQRNGIVNNVELLKNSMNFWRKQSRKTDNDIQKTFFGDNGGDVLQRRHFELIKEMNDATSHRQKLEAVIEKIDNEIESKRKCVTDDVFMTALKEIFNEKYETENTLRTYEKFFDVVFVRRDDDDKLGRGKAAKILTKMRSFDVESEPVNRFSHVNGLWLEFQTN